MLTSAEKKLCREQIQWANHMLTWCNLSFEEQVAADPTHTNDEQGQEDIAYYREEFTKILERNTEKLANG